MCSHPVSPFSQQGILRADTQVRPCNLNSFPREMEGSRDRGGTELSEHRGSEMWQQRDSSLAGSCLWIRLRSLACWSSAAPWKLDGLKLWVIKTCRALFNHIESPSWRTPLLLHSSQCFPPPSLSVSSSLSLQSPYCSESWFSLSKWLDCFSAGEFTSDVYTEAWTGPQAMPAIDFTMILIRGLPVAIDTIHQCTAQWNWWPQIGSHIWLPINHTVDYF